MLLCITVMMAGECDAKRPTRSAAIHLADALVILIYISIRYERYEARQARPSCARPSFEPVRGFRP